MSRPARRAGTGPGDADLLNRVRAGDRGALDELYDRFSRPALALAHRVLLDDAVAEEVLREAFLAVWHDPGAYDRASDSVGRSRWRTTAGTPSARSPPSPAHRWTWSRPPC